MAGGARKGAGRKPLPEKEKKKPYTTKIKPNQIKWLRSKPRGWAAKFLERVIDKAMEEESKKG